MALKVEMEPLAGLEGVYQGPLHDELEVADLDEPVRNGVQDAQGEQDEDEPAAPEPGVDEGEDLFQ